MPSLLLILLGIAVWTKNDTFLKTVEKEAGDINALGPLKDRMTWAISYSSEYTKYALANPIDWYFCPHEQGHVLNDSLNRFLDIFCVI